MVTLITAIVVFVALLGFHFGAGHTHHRYQKAAGRKPRLYASLGRGAFVWGSLPLPGGFRVGHRL